MFSHTQSLDQQAQKLSSTSIIQPDEPIDIVDEVDNSAEQSEVISESESTVDEPAEQLPDQLSEQSTDLIAEAEQRGFQRAMALRIDELFNRPTSGSPTFPNPDPDEAAASDIVFLSRVRRSVWD